LSALQEKHFRRDPPDVPESLYGDARALQRHAMSFSGLAARDHDAAARGLDAAARPADRDRLSGDDARDGVTHVHGGRVHEPRHRLGVRDDVWGWEGVFW